MQSVEELIIQRPSIANSIEDSRAAPIKSILFVVHDDDDLEGRMQAALSVARACSAHLHFLHVIPFEAYTVADTFGTSFVSGEIFEALQEQAAKLRKRLEEHLNKEDVSWSYELTSAVTLWELLTSSAFADLVFIGRQPSWHEFGRTGPGLLGAFIRGTHTPLCILGDGREGMDPFGNAMIAWNGSIEGANAIRSAIGLLRMSSAVRVVRFVEDNETAFPDTSLLEYLSRHGIHAKMETHLAKKQIAEDLVELATHAGAEYIVMGGYSHSRAGEFLFGGITRELLRACPISLVMAH